MNRARNLSPTSDKIDRHAEMVVGLLVATSFIALYLGTIGVMHAVLALGWYVA